MYARLKIQIKKQKIKKQETKKRLTKSCGQEVGVMSCHGLVSFILMY